MIPPRETPEEPRPAASSNACVPERRHPTMGLGFLFATLYFIQGIGEPTEGLIAQPVRSLLDSWGHSAKEIGVFGMILSLPWTIKPLFGFLTDFVPLWRRRRKSYLILVNASALTGLLMLYLWSPHKGVLWLLLAVLLVPTVAVAFADVVVDALMVEKGQPLGITGRLQSIQWAGMYTATIITGLLGGYLTAHDRQDLAFLICLAVMVPALLLAVFVVQERPYQQGIPSWRVAQEALCQAARTPGILAVGGFLFLLNFNPFSSTVLQLHMKHGLLLSDEFYGQCVSMEAVAAVMASICYGLYCRRLASTTLIHLSIILSIFSTISYWALFNRSSAITVTVAAGYIYMTATLIQLDLAARICPPQAAGTVFALLMSLSNLGTSLGIGVGGYLYDSGIAQWNSRYVSFNVLVGVGAGFTACCWLLVPHLRRAFRAVPLAPLSS